MSAPHPLEGRDRISDEELNQRGWGFVHPRGYRGTIFDPKGSPGEGFKLAYARRDADARTVFIEDLIR